MCAVVVDVVHPALRSTAASVLSLTQNLFGLAAGPLLAGVMSDRYGLPFALSVVPLFCVLAAIVFAAILGSASSGALAQASASADDVSRAVDIGGGRHLFLECRGGGSPPAAKDIPVRTRKTAGPLCLWRLGHGH